MTLIWEDKAQKQLERLDSTMKARILDYMDRVATLACPKTRGKPLTGNRKGQWRYRVGDYRIICKIQDDVLIITVIEVGHRKEIYK